MARGASGDGGTVSLDSGEARDVADRGLPRAAVVFETIRREGALDLRRPVLSLGASGFAAGLAMGMSLAGQAMLQALLPDARWRPLVTSAGYTLGFVIVVLGRQQLLTENTLTAILPLLDDPDKPKMARRVMRLWAIVLVANLAGAAAFAFALAHAPIFGPAVDTAMRQIGERAAAPDFGTLVVRGIVAGWLIALMVWLLPAAEGAKLFVIVIMTYAVGLGSLAHIIAGSVDVLYLVAVGARSWPAYARDFLLPVFLGNTLGGTALVALLNYAQVAVEDDAAPG